MILSMTGYGKGRASAGGETLGAEVRSVNGKGLEVRLRVPQDLAELEASLRERVSSQVSRGRVDVAIAFDRQTGGVSRYRLNEEAATEMMSAWETLRARFDLDDTPSVAAIMRLPGVLEPVGSEEPDLDALGSLARAALDEALAQHREAREREGARLAADLESRFRTIKGLVDEIRGLVKGSAERVSAVIRARIEPLMGEVPLDEQRLAQEIAIVAQRADVTEELVRLEAHLSRWEKLHAEGASEVGRSLEFLVQEVRREVNTLSAKVGTPESDERVLAIKGELEKVREQAANLE